MIKAQRLRHPPVSSSPWLPIDLTDIAFDGPLAQRGIGIIAPFDLALERELWRWAPLDVSLHLARTPYEEISVSLGMAELVSEAHHVQAATRDVLSVDPEIVAYLCTSGSFINGVSGEAELRQAIVAAGAPRSEEHTSELQSRGHLVCRLLLEKKNNSSTLGNPNCCK